MPAGLWPVLQVWLIGTRAIWPVGLCLFFSLNHSVCALTIWLKLDMCDFIHIRDCKVYNSSTLLTFWGQNQPWWGSTNCCHCTPHIYSANTKDSLSVLYPSLNLLDLYYRPVLIALPVWDPTRPPPQLPTMSCQKALVIPSYTLGASVVHSMPKAPDRGLFLWAQWHLAPMPGCLLSGGAVSLLLLVPY